MLSPGLSRFIAANPVGVDLFRISVLFQGRSSRGRHHRVSAGIRFRLCLCRPRQVVIWIRRSGAGDNVPGVATRGLPTKGGLQTKTLAGVSRRRRSI